MLTVPLYPYQDPAVDRFLDRGSLLVAYEMGLGKTPIAIACAEELLGCGDIRTCLLVVPASLKYQWAQSLAKFTDLPRRTLTLKGEEITVPEVRGCVIIDGPPARRRKQWAQVTEHHPDYVIVSYETVISDTRMVKRVRAGMTVLDEASAIKSFAAKRTQIIKRSLMTEYRLALTGTPVENKPEEAFSIMEWVDANVLGPFDLFEKAYIDRWPNGSVKKYKNIKVLNHRLNVAMSRRSRTDPDVAPYLPEVDHDQWYVDLDKGTAKVYDSMAGDLLGTLLAVRGGGSFDMAAYYAGEGGNDSSGLGLVMARQGAIELMLGHPRLVELSAANYLDKDTDAGSSYCAEVIRSGVLEDAQTPKLDYLMDRLDEILVFPENKILVFSRYPEMLSLIEDRLPCRAVQYHGRMTAREKAAAVTQFRNDSDVRVFLSSHAGAYGTDMHMANYLINYDLSWSGGMDDQINGRHQRASSEFSRVFIRDIIMRGTTEERKLAVIRYKQRVMNAVVDGRAPRTQEISNDLVSLTDFLQG